MSLPSLRLSARLCHQFLSSPMHSASSRAELSNVRPTPQQKDQIRVRSRSEQSNEQPLTRSATVSSSGPSKSRSSRPERWPSPSPTPGRLRLRGQRLSHPESRGPRDVARLHHHEGRRNTSCSARAVSVFPQPALELSGLMVRLDDHCIPSRTISGHALPIAAILSQIDQCTEFAAAQCLLE